MTTIDFAQPAQSYATTLYHGTDAFTFTVIPARSFLDGSVPSLVELADALRLEQTERLPVWALPLAFDAMMGRPVDIREDPELVGRHVFAYRLGDRPNLGPSVFAEHLAYAPVVPFEASEARSRSITEVATGGGGVGIVVGAYATTEPLILILVPAGIVVCRVGYHVGDEIGLLLRRLIRRIAPDDRD